MDSRLNRAVQQLLDVLVNDPKDLPHPEFGLCANITKAMLDLQALESDEQDYTNLAEAKNRVKEVSKTWEKYSGDEDFPIPSTVGSMSVGRAYTSLPHYEGGQLELRIDWLRHLVKCV